VVLLGQIWVYAGKKRVLGEEEGRTSLGGRRSVEMYHKCKNSPNMSLFITRVLEAYYLLHFSLFYKKKLYFTLSLNK